jgi:2-polyprenyl-6-methoxyphenol hydroxylase-like FAD-dependent oxidoreductase
LDVERPVDFVSASDAGESITAELSDAEGRVRRITARWLVGCDGAHSAVRACAGIGFDGGDYAETFVLADVRMDFPLPRDEVSLFFSPRGLMVVAPLPDPDGRSTNRYRIVATVEDAKGEPSMSDVQTLLDARGPARVHAKVLELQWSSNFHIQHRVASEVLKGRVLLCGDAAHVHSPAGGQGMNTGIQDAVALAEPLRHALRQGHRDALADWAAQRQKVAREVVRMTHVLTRAATADSAIERSVRNAALGLVGHLPFIQHRLAARLAELAR